MEIERQSPLLPQSRVRGGAFRMDPDPPAVTNPTTQVPNYFVNGGAYCPSAHGSFFPIIQAYTDYEIEVITKMQVEKIRSVRPKSLPTEHFLRHATTFLKRTAWTGPCSSWFKGGKIDGNPVRCANSCDSAFLSGTDPARQFIPVVDC